MCLVAWASAWRSDLPLVLAANRDEFRDRPSAPIHWWRPHEGADPVLGGRDLRAGGSWLALNRAGQLALVTNIRDARQPQAGGPSRGALVPRCLQSAATAQPGDWMAREGYKLVNLLRADTSGGWAHWCSSSQPVGQTLGPGVYGLSNAALDTPWPKVSRLKQSLVDALRDMPAGVPAPMLADRLLIALADTTQPADVDLPDTGVGLPAERMLAPVFVNSPDGRYGTRSSTVVIAQRLDGRRVTHVFEKTYEQAGASGTLRHILLEEPLDPAGS